MTLSATSLVTTAAIIRNDHWEPALGGWPRRGGVCWRTLKFAARASSVGTSRRTARCRPRSSAASRARTATSPATTPSVWSRPTGRERPLDGPRPRGKWEARARLESASWRQLAPLDAESQSEFVSIAASQGRAATCKVGIISSRAPRGRRRKQGVPPSGFLLSSSARGTFRFARF